MSECYNKLLIDQGNTAIKYCFVDNHGKLSAVRVVAKPDEIPLENIESVRIASVASEHDVDQLISRISENVSDCKRILTQEEAFGISCAYHHFRNLGVDRWLVVLAAAALTDSPCAIIDFGTANTVDFLVENRHIGGWIAPGYDLMKSSLTNHTANVVADDQFPQKLSPGVTTESCVAQGSLSVLYGTLLIAQAELDKIAANGKIFLTGGQAKALNLSEFSRVEFREKLVFEGLNRFI